MTPEHKAAARRWMIDCAEAEGQRGHGVTSGWLADRWIAVYSGPRTPADALNVDVPAMLAIAVDALSTVAERRAARKAQP